MSNDDEKKTPPKPTWLETALIFTLIGGILAVGGGSMLAFLVSLATR
jgi:hypothetical protein